MVNLSVCVEIWKTKKRKDYFWAERDLLYIKILK